MIKLTNEVYIVDGGRNGVRISNDYASFFMAEFTPQEASNFRSRKNEGA